MKRRKSKRDVSVNDDIIAEPSANAETTVQLINQQVSTLYSSCYDQWLRSFGLVSCWEVPKFDRDEFIFHGYRPLPSSFLFTLKSIFQPTNETLNVWTHFIPFLLLLYRSVDVYLSLPDDSLEISAYLPYWIHSFGCLQVLLFSAAAHAFNCMSPLSYQACFLVDYGGIVLFGVTAGLVSDMYLCPHSCITSFAGVSLSPVIYALIAIFMGYAAHTISCYSRYPECNFVLIKRYGTFIVLFIFFSVSCFFRHIFSSLMTYFGIEDTAYSIEGMCKLGMPNDLLIFLSHLGFFFIAIVWITLKFPERWFPGMFDIIGQSHQVFHLLIAGGLYTHNVLVENAAKDLRRRISEKLISESAIPNVEHSIISIVILVVALFYNVIVHSRKVASIIGKCEKTM